MGCPVVVSQCSCNQSDEPHTIHTCDCGGAFEYDADRDMVTMVHRWPGGKATTGSILGDLMEGII